MGYRYCIECGASGDEEEMMYVHGDAYCQECAEEKIAEGEDELSPDANFDARDKDDDGEELYFP